jgi:hypothetical protein
MLMHTQATFPAYPIPLSSFALLPPTRAKPLISSCLSVMLENKRVVEKEAEHGNHALGAAVVAGDSA